MPFCPECRSEYREGITRCTPCDVALVASLNDARLNMDDESVLAYLRDKDLTPILESTVEKLKPMQLLLYQSGVPSLILRDEGGAGCSSGGCGGVKLQLVVATTDVERAGQALHEEFLKLVGSVSDEEDESHRVANTIDILAESNQCPACDAMLPRGAETCPDCGLYVGVPAELLEADACEEKGGCGSCR